MKALTIRHIVPGLGKVPRSPSTEGVSGLVGAALGISRAQVQSGHCVELHGWRPQAGPRHFTIDGVAVQTTPGWQWARLRGIDLRIIAPLLALSLRGRPIDVAHVYSDPHLLLAPRARMRVLHYQTPVPERPTRAYKALVQRANLVVFCSEYLRQQFLKHVEFSHERTFTLYNGMDLEQYIDLDNQSNSEPRRANSDEMIILYAGAIVPQKGLLHLLQAVRSISHQLPIRLIIAGGSQLWPTPDNPNPQSDDEYSLAVKAAAEGLRITWLSVVPAQEIPKVYASADIVVCPSIWAEPLGTVNVEAMAAGRPVVASRVGGIPEAVLDGITGLLVPPGDHYALAKALCTLATDPALRLRMGQAARQRAMAFSWKLAADRLIDSYRSVLG